MRRRTRLVGNDWLKKKSVGPYLLLVPHSEAFALPIFIERANAEASRRYMNIDHRHAHACTMENIHTHSGIYRLLIPDEDFEICEVSECQKRASSKRFSLCFAKAVRSDACAVRTRQGVCFASRPHSRYRGF